MLSPSKQGTGYPGGTTLINCTYARFTLTSLTRNVRCIFMQKLPGRFYTVLQKARTIRLLSVAFPHIY